MDQVSQTQQVKMDGVEVKASPPSADVFVSYASDAGEWAERFIDLLTRPGARVDSAAEGTRSPARQKPGSQRYAAFVALVTPEFVENNEAGIDTSVFIGPGGGGARRFAVHLRRAPWQELPWMARFTFLPADGHAVLDAGDPERVLAEIAGAIRAQVDEVQPQPQEPSPAPAGDDALRRLAETYRYGPGVALVLAQAAELTRSATEQLPGGRVLLDTPTLFVAIASLGDPYRAPQWTGDWLLREAGPVVERLRERPRSGTGAELWPGSQPGISQGVGAVLQAASSIAEQTSGRPLAHTRHLLAALITDPRGSASRLLRLLSGYGADARSSLGGPFFDFVSGDAEDDAAWARVLRVDLPDQRLLAHFDADDSRTRDYLGVERDAVAFARLIAARTLVPPLSIGLFGEWGSGKTFFMRMLRGEVDRLAREAEASGQMQCDVPYWKRIVQIEFNAWHYVEENLWANLAQHIFQSLRAPHAASESRDLQASLSAAVEKEKQLQAAAEQRREEAEQQLTAAREELENAQQTLSEAELKVAREGVLARIDRAELRDAGAEALARLGFVDLEASSGDLYESLRSARAELTRARGVLAPLFRGTPGQRARRWLLLALALLAAPAAALLARWVLDALGAQGRTQVAEAVLGAAGLIGSGAAWVRKQLATARHWLGQVENVQGRLDEHLEAEHGRVREAQAQVSAGTAASADALRELQAARNSVAAAETRLREASLADELTHFVAERITSDQYGRELGTLARIRIDLERLSRLIGEENCRLVPPVPDEGASGPALPRYATLEDERRNQDGRVNRIVLYIDDLDRCPPARVVEVLQAVHLLLAFPLFVVVVGVDARWITRSLQVRYRELLKADPAAMGDFEEMVGSASAYDYLEKIFQVPFWLRSMSDEAAQEMVAGLLKPSMAKQPAAPLSPSGDGPAAGQPSAPPPGGTAAVPGTPPARAAEVAPRGEAGQRVEVVQQAGEPAPKREETDLSAGSLEITGAELQAMNELAPLLGRSPRALKRFVNVYRLVKASLTPAERRRFLPGDGGAGECRSVLFLLAVDTGAPLAAGVVFHAITDAAAKRGEDSDDPLADAISAIDKHPSISGPKRDPRTAEHWVRVKRWLQTASVAQRIRDGDIDRLARWVPRISRFSFHAGRAIPPIAAGPEPDAAVEESA